jgi:gas vesicle protein GvpL/GvpF
MEACYVYGVVAEPDADAVVRELPAVGDGDTGTHVGWVRHGGIAAAVSGLRTNRPLGTPEDLRAHARVLDTLAATGAPVLPFRFGTVLGDERAVTDEVLADGHDAFAAALDRLRGRAQFTLRARYERDAVLREVLADRPDITELRDRTAGLPEEAARYERVRLGELVAEAVTAKREEDAAELDRRLAPVADARTLSEPAEEDGVADASFLVAAGRSAAFEQAAEDLARHWSGRIRLRLLGPLAPYDFVADAMGGAGATPGGEE